MEVLGKETNSVGLNISTKKIGSNFREDITDEYKFKEGRHKINTVSTRRTGIVPGTVFKHCILYTLPFPIPTYGNIS